jgi:hypothetical protein
MDQILIDNGMSPQTTCYKRWGKEIEPYKVDGYDENEKGQQYVLEFNGKFWHGWLHRYNASSVNPVNDMTMCVLYQRPMRGNDTWKVKGISTLESGNASSIEKFMRTTLYETLSNNPR